MWQFSRLIKLLILVLSAALLLAACGGGGTDTPSGSPQGFVPVNQQQATPTPESLATPDVQATEQTNHCDVTKPATAFPPGVSTSGYYAPWYQSKDGQLWFTTGAFFLSQEGLQVPANQFWFQGPNPIIVLSSGSPRISGHLIGQSSVAVTTSTSPDQDILSAESQTQLPSHATTINLPKPGCWQITVASGGHSLSVTARTIPFNTRPDIAALIHQRKAFAPYPVPASCPVTKWSAPKPGMPRYAIEGQGATLFMYIPAFYAGYQQQINLTGDQSPEPKVAGTLIGNDAAVVRAGSWVVNSNLFGGQAWQGKVNVSTPGCWKVRLKAASGTVDATIYVYPGNCAHNIGGPVPSTCSKPK